MSQGLSHTLCLTPIAIALALVCAPAHADLYGFIDENGKAHFSNQPDDPRYILFMKQPKVEAAAQLPESVGQNAVSARRYRQEIEDAARIHQVDARLIQAVVETESGYNPHAISPRGAMGLMQLMPDTARRFGISDLFDVRQNLAGGARYLAELLQLFSNKLDLAIAAYNAGEGAVQRHGNRIPPYRETRDYVPKVLQRYDELVRLGQSAS